MTEITQQQKEMFNLLEFIIDFDKELKDSSFRLSDWTNAELMNYFEDYKEKDKEEKETKLKQEVTTKKATTKSKSTKSTKSTTNKKSKSNKKLTSYNLFCREKRIQNYDFKECSLLWGKLTKDEKDDYKNKVNQLNSDNGFEVKTKKTKKDKVENNIHIIRNYV